MYIKEKNARRAPLPVMVERVAGPRVVENPPNPWSSTHVEWLGEAPPSELVIYEEAAGEIVAENQSPDVGFRFSVNPYRGCYHACAYCYARPSHQYLGFGAGTDFERRIVVKTNAAAALRKTFERRGWTGEVVVFSGNTDCYQPLEASYALTRACLEVCLDYRNPVGVITKGALIRRDVDVLAQLARETSVAVHVSIPFLDADVARAVEPFVGTPAQRLQTIRILADAGVPVGVSISPIIPGLNDAHVPLILEEARAAGATSAFMILLRLPAEVLPVFEARMRRAFPLRFAHIMSALKDLRGGRANEPRFGARMRGDGPRWDVLTQLFRAQCRRLGLSCGTRWTDDARPSTFRRPRAQGDLFEV